MYFDKCCLPTIQKNLHEIKNDFKSTYMIYSLAQFTMFHYQYALVKGRHSNVITNMKSLITKIRYKMYLIIHTRTLTSWTDELI